MSSTIARLFVIAAVISLIASGCSAPVEETLEAPPTSAPTEAPPADEAGEAPPADSADDGSAQGSEPTESPVEDPQSDESMESPASPADAFSAPVTAQGDLLIVTGRVLDVNGSPIPGAAVEFWQTDAEGIYDHPGDSGTANRDAGFQFYGTSIADAEGMYIFRTILPGRYEPRPPHIHLKVKVDGRELLTSQYYFSPEAIGSGVSGDNANLVVPMTQETSSDGTPVFIGMYDLVVDTGIGAGSLRLTDSQGEGPYYPLVDVSAFDNDLANVQ